MDFGSITLLEICQSAHGSRLAYCLTRGEFLFVTPQASNYFLARSAGDLFGKNLREFVVACDLEKLQDYIREHTNHGGLNSVITSKLTMMVRLVGSGKSLWVRLKTVPLGLRLLRCIDSVTVLASLKHHFADLSSFMVSEDDLAAVFSLASPKATDAAAGVSTQGLATENETPLSIAIPTNSYEAPLELKSVPSPSHRDAVLMSMSPASPTGMLDAFDESLSSLAFEADWAAEAASTI